MRNKNIVGPKTTPRGTPTNIASDSGGSTSYLVIMFRLWKRSILFFLLLLLFCFVFRDDTIVCDVFFLFHSSSKKATRDLVEPDLLFFNVEYLFSPNFTCSSCRWSNSVCFSPTFSTAISDLSSRSWFCKCFDFCRYSTL